LDWQDAKTISIGRDTRRGSLARDRAKRGSELATVSFGSRADLKQQNSGV
jgi:hypothetical protein